MINIILLAAGSSRRFGEDKLMWPIDGKPMICHTLEKLISVSSRHSWAVTVVTKEGPVCELLKKYPVSVCINHDHASGISTSIKCGLSHIPDANSPAVFLVADQPWLEEKTIEDFILSFLSSGNICACVTHAGESGNPCIFAPSLFPELMQLTGDRGGKRVIMQHLDDCYKYEVVNSIQLTDLDTKPIA